MRVPKNTPCAATPDELAEYAEGLICLTGDRRGPLAHALHSSTWHESLHNPLIRRRDADPIVLVEWLLETFGRGNVYAELQRHLIREEEWRNQATVDIASKLKVPLLATTEPVIRPAIKDRCWMYLHAFATMCVLMKQEDCWPGIPSTILRHLPS